MKLIEALLNHSNLAKQCPNKDDLMIDYDRNVFQVFFCEIKDIHRPADIYGGNGASWEAVPSIEKPLVRGREEDDIKAIHELFFFCPKLLLSSIYIYLI